MKKLLLLSLFLSIFTHYTTGEQTLFIPEKHAVSRITFAPENTIILSDMHEVFMKPVKNRIFDTIWNYDNKMSIIRHADFKTIKITAKFLLGKIGLVTPLTNEEHIIQAAKNANNDALIDIIIKGGSGYEPMPETITLYQDLHTQGYQLDLGSNVASTVFASFRKGHPNLFDTDKGLFTNYHVIRTDILRKPNIEYFTSYNQTYNKTKKYVIFVDDKKENVLAAQKADMIGILFITAQQLQADLHSLGIVNTIDINYNPQAIAE